MSYLETYRTFEGKYDRMTRILVDDLITKIKESINEKGDYGDEFEIFYIGTYTGTLKECNLFLHIDRKNKAKLSKDENKMYIRDGYFLDGNCVNSSISEIINDEDIDLDDLYDEDNISTESDGAINIFCKINPKIEEKVYSNIYYELQDIVRHEIEHLTQGGKNILPNKEKHTNFEERNRIRKSEQYFKYYLLVDEVPAIVRGLYRLAKKLRRPLLEIFKNNINGLKDRGLISNSQVEILLDEWIKYAIKNKLINK